MSDGVKRPAESPRRGTAPVARPAPRLSQRELVLQSLVRCPARRGATAKR